MNEKTPRSSSRKVVARYSEPVLAHLAQAKLEAEGIPAFIRDVNTVGIQWLYGPAVGWIRVEVDEENEKEAKQILASEQDSDFALEEWSSHASPDKHCPRCGSQDLSKAPYRPSSLMRIVLKLSPFRGPRTVVTCQTCGKTWKE